MLILGGVSTAVMATLAMAVAVFLQGAAAQQRSGAGSAVATVRGYQQAFKDGEQLDVYVYMSPQQAEILKSALA
jgi:hypothetical protein